jgi:ribosomal protein S18 acetylase RimI-like enzyme
MARTARPQIAVRRARRGEWRELRDLRLRALEADPLAFSSTADEERSLAEGRWRERAVKGAESPDSSTWVAVGPRGRLVGMAVVAQVEGVQHVFSMWVDPEVRGRGLGGRLLDAALTWARQTCPGGEIHLEVNPRQAAAAALYRSRGFRYTASSRPLGHSGAEAVQEMVLSALPADRP